MRVHDLIAQHSILWPPPVATSVRPFENLPVASEVRQAVLESVFWREDDTPAWVQLHLQFHGRMITASLSCLPGQERVYQQLFWTLQGATGRTLADIEKLEVAL
jgi:hypothetical protein